MNTARPLNETPKQRLVRVARSSRPFQWEWYGPKYLIAVALLMLLGIIIVAGVLGGTPGYEFVAEYARRIIEWAR